MSLTDHISTRTFKATRCRRCSIVIGFGDTCDWCQQRPTGHVDQPGEYMGRHHSEWIGTVQVLTQEDDVYALEQLLVHLVATARAEAESTGNNGHRWYEDQLTALGESTTPNRPSRSMNAA